jgi:hypothetical protein
MSCLQQRGARVGALAAPPLPPAPAAPLAAQGWSRCAEGRGGDAVHGARRSGSAAGRPGQAGKLRARCRRRYPLLPGAGVPALDEREHGRPAARGMLGVAGLRAASVVKVVEAVGEENGVGELEQRHRALQRLHGGQALRGSRRRGVRWVLEEGALRALRHRALHVRSSSLGSGCCSRGGAGGPAARCAARPLLPPGRSPLRRRPPPAAQPRAAAPGAWPPGPSAHLGVADFGALVGVGLAREGLDELLVVHQQHLAHVVGPGWPPPGGLQVRHAQAALPPVRQVLPQPIPAGRAEG